MNRHVHEAALRAAAKLTFSMGLVTACGEVAPEPTRSPADEAELATTEPGDDSPSEPVVTADAAAARTDAAPEPLDASPAGCTQLVDERIARDAGGKDDAEFLACCQALADANDQSWQDGGPDLWTWQERSVCCSALDWNGPMSCTPWGPPAPPRLDWVA